MMYYWDRRVHKVTYAGTVSATFNGTYGANNWRSYWGQWDIATGTNDYTNINSQTADPRAAGNNANNSLVYRMDGRMKKKSVSLSVGRGEKLPVSKGAGLTEKGRAKYNAATGSNLKVQ